MTAILYAAKKKLSDDHWPVKNYLRNRTIYVRMQLVKSSNIERAVAQARPRVGETVLNAIPL